MTSFLDTAQQTYGGVIQRSAQLRATSPQRTPVVTALIQVLGVMLGWLAARGVLTARAVRRVGLNLAGLGFCCWAAFSWNHIAGLAAVGLSLLLIDALSTHTGNGE